MKNNIFTIVKKELYRFFTDKRMVVTTLLLPGLMIYLMYTFMGDALSDIYTADDTYIPKAAVVHLPDSIHSIVPSDKFEFIEIGDNEIDAAKSKVKDHNLDVCIIFPQNFDTAVASYKIEFNVLPPQVEIYYDSTDAESQTAYMTFSEILNQYESALSNKFDINAGDGNYDLADSKNITGTIFASMLPMLLMMFLYSGCMAVAPESIAGEKERGTIATLLVTPIKRSQLAVGKIIALALIALASGCSSSVGTLLSLPKLMGGAASGELSAVVYGVTDYLMLAVIILSTVLLMITMISILSAFAKTVKEAQTFVLPLMILVMLTGISGMFGSAQTEWYFYLIPFYNSVQCMIGVFAFTVQLSHILITILMNIIYTVVGVFALERIFNNEKIIFAR